MNYDSLSHLFSRYQTSRIKSLYIPESCAPDLIPDSFGLFISDVFKIMESHFNELSLGMPQIGVFGLQAVSTPLESLLPERLKRIFIKLGVNSHLCCSLSYLPTARESAAEIRDWSEARTLIIDFTCGLVMDKEQYFYELFKMGSPGKIYGQFRQKKLDKVWQFSAQWGTQFNPA